MTYFEKAMRRHMTERPWSMLAAAVLGVLLGCVAYDISHAGQVRAAAQESPRWRMVDRTAVSDRSWVVTVADTWTWKCSAVFISIGYLESASSPLGEVPCQKK